MVKDEVNKGYSMSDGQYNVSGSISDEFGSVRNISNLESKVVSGSNGSSDLDVSNVPVNVAVIRKYTAAELTKASALRRTAYLTFAGSTIGMIVSDLIGNEEITGLSYGLMVGSGLTYAYSRIKENYLRRSN